LKSQTNKATIHGAFRQEIIKIVYNNNNNNNNLKKAKKIFCLKGKVSNPFWDPFFLFDR